MQTPERPAIPEVMLEVVDTVGPARLVRVTHSPFSIGRGAEAGNDLQLVDTCLSGCFSKPLGIVYGRAAAAFS